MMDQVHGRPDGTARRNFGTNKAEPDRLIEGKHYYALTYEQMLSMDEFRPLAKPKGLTVLTERGYLVLVKSFTDDLAMLCTVHRSGARGHDLGIIGA